MKVYRTKNILQPYQEKVCSAGEFIYSMVNEIGKGAGREKIWFLLIFNSGETPGLTCSLSSDWIQKSSAQAAVNREKSSFQ